MSNEQPRTGIPSKEARTDTTQHTHEGIRGMRGTERPSNNFILIDDLEDTQGDEDDHR